MVSSAGIPPLVGTAARRRRALAHLSPIFDLHLYRARNPSDVDWSAYDFIALVQLTVDTIALSSGLDGNLGAPRDLVLIEMTRTAAAMAPQRPTDEHAHVAAHVLDHLLRHDEPTPYFAVGYADPDAGWQPATQQVRVLYETLAADGSTLQVNVDNTAVTLLLIATNRSLEDEHEAVIAVMRAQADSGRHCCICCERALSRQTVVMRPCRPRPATVPRSAFAGFCFPPEVIVLAVGWYLRFGLSFRDVEELLAERGIQVDHVTVFRWVQRFTPLLAEAARPCRHGVGDRWQVDETYVKVAGRWRYVYRAIDQFSQVIDVFVSLRRDVKAARRFFERAIGTTKRAPVEVITDKAAAYPAMLEELLPGAWHRTDRYANNHIEADHGRLKARLRPMRGLKQDRSARVVIAGHALVQNVRRGHYELAVESPVNRRVAVAFDELALVI